MQVQRIGHRSAGEGRASGWGKQLEANKTDKKHVAETALPTVMLMVMLMVMLSSVADADGDADSDVHGDADCDNWSMPYVLSH